MQERIIGGTQGAINNFPWQVAVILNSALYCAGSIISQTTVLTAASCVYNQLVADICVRADSSYFNTGGIVVHASGYAYHAQYSSITGQNDIGIIRLQSALAFGTTIKSGTLPALNQAIPYGYLGRIAGWGQQQEGNTLSYSPNILYTDATLISPEQCNIYYPNQIYPGMFCAGFVEGGKGPCYGDGGGAVTYGDTLLGIISRGTGCARPNAPGIYTNVAFYSDWIKQFL